MTVVTPKYYMQRTVTTSSYHYILTKGEYEELDDALTSQWEALYLEQKYDFLVENYLEFEETILRNGLEYMILGRSDSRNFDTYTLLFNRRVMNFLTAYRTYDDGFQQHFNKIFSRDKAITEKAKSSFSAEFDSREGYWLVALLRNLVQHQGFPIHGSTYGSQWVAQRDDAEKHLNRYTIDLFIKREELLRGGFNEKQLAKLESIIDKVDLKFVIRDFMEGYSAAHVKNRALLVEKLTWAAQVVSDYEKKFMEASGDRSAVALLAVSTDSVDPQIYLHQIAIEQRAYLEKKNQALVKLASRYISNELFSDKVFAKGSEAL
jgi:hypothetical protein